MKWDTINMFTSSLTSTERAKYVQAYICNKINVHKSFLNVKLLGKQTHTHYILNIV